MLFKIIKKIITGMLVFAICLGCVSCSKQEDVTDENQTQTTKVDETLYSEVKEIQNNVLLLDSGKLDITSQADSTKNTELIKADFVFDISDDGRLSYIQYQYDKKGKIIACEYSNGITIEQWLIGNGWCTMSTNPYTNENTHRYLQLISNTPEINAINSITMEEKTNTDLYTLTMNAEELNNTTYKDSDTKVNTKMIEINVDKEGELTSYLNTAKVTDEVTEEENIYTLEIVLSEYDDEIERPELKEYNHNKNTEHSENQ